MTTATVQMANRDMVANTNAQNEKLITVAEVAELLGVSQTTIYNWSNPTSPDRMAGFPAPVALGEKRTRFLNSHVQAFIAGLASTGDRKHHFRKQKAA